MKLDGEDGGAVTDAERDHARERLKKPENEKALAAHETAGPKPRTIWDENKGHKGAPTECQSLVSHGANTSMKLHALHPPPSADPTQRDICCRTFARRPEICRQRDYRWLDDNPVERMKVIRERLGGIEDEVEGKPYGRNLRCPMPICHGKHTLKIGIGRLRNRLVVRCKNRAHNQNALVRAVTKATGVSLFPRPRPASPSEIMGRMLHAVEQMRLTPQYEGLSPLSKALVEHLVEAIFDNGESNGGIDRTGTNLMGVFDIHSWRQFYEAVNEAIDAGIVFRGSRGLSHGYKSGPSNLWGLVCLPDEREGRSSKRAKASLKPHKNVSRLRKKGGRTWWENVQKVGERAAQPFDNTSYDLGVVRRRKSKPARRHPRGAGGGPTGNRRSARHGCGWRSVLGCVLGRLLLITSRARAQRDG